ncbi:hypothetical protein SCLCIDRAFT_54330, partial [Scleroderma citrinum Foug A]
VTQGPFQHECTLDTLAFFLESTHYVPSNVCARKNPRAALALATVAVERAFRYWASGYFVLPEKKSLRKFSATLWAFATNEIMDSVDKLSEKKWKKI